MMTQFIANDLPLFFVRIATVTFFSIGFIQYFQRLWYDTFEHENKTPLAYWVRRVALTLITVGLGLFIHYDAMLFIHNSSAILYHNWALFVLVLPLLFNHFGKIEVGIQTLALLSVWIMHHAPTLWQPADLIALLAFTSACILLKIYREYVMHNWWIGVAGAFVIASLFWFTVPSESMGMRTTPDLALEAVLLYTLMIAFVLGYWLRQYREDRRKRELERLADYEKGSHANSYANHQQELQTLFANTQAADHTLSFATLDLDHFRKLNDRYGHLAGNAVLIGVTQTMRDILENANVNYQMFMTTGEEFNLVFPDRAPADIMPVITACWQGIRKREFAYEDRNITVTMSIGLTALRREDASVNDIYKRADDALSKSKRNGRDAITLDQKVVSGSDQSEKRLADYRYFAQGVYNINQDGAPKAYHELLLRTYDPLQKRWILPDSFEIPVWMQITLLKEFMLHTPLQHFNLNLTAAQFQDLDIATALAQFAESAEGPDSLTIEIMDLTDSQTTRRISALYRSAGMAILIDDVGSDNSFEGVQGSLPYVNGIKFAMQNLRKTTTDAAIRERVAFWRQIAAERHLKFILEGVENAADLELARDLGITYVQGYYFGKPDMAEGLREAGN